MFSENRHTAAARIVTSPTLFPLVITSASADLYSQEENEISGSRGEANFVWKCKNCKREATANIVDAPKPYAQSDPPKAQQIIKIDTRGCEFTDFRPDGDWICKGADSGTEFKGDILNEDEYFDYDEKAGEEVSIKELKWEIKKA